MKVLPNRTEEAMHVGAALVQLDILRPSVWRAAMKHRPPHSALSTALYALVDQEVIDQAKALEERYRAGDQLGIAIDVVEHATQESIGFTQALAQLVDKRRAEGRAVCQDSGAFLRAVKEPA